MSAQSSVVRFLGPSRCDARGTLSPGIILFTLLAPLSFLGDLREEWLPYLILCTSATLFLYLVVFVKTKRDRDVSFLGVMAVALLLRLAMLPMQPSLSDDAYRYLWDGRLLLHGYNPYHYVPADPHLEEFHDELFEVQGYPTTHTIYPPGAQVVFATAAAFGELFGRTFGIGYLLYKLFLIAAEMTAIWLLLQLLKGRNRPIRYGILYAWHPLAIVELSGQGHTDGFWVLSLGLAFWFYYRNIADRGVVGLAFGTCIRLFPVLLLPLWARFLKRKDFLVGLLLALPLFLLLLAFLDPIAFDTYSTVLTRFTNFYEFNGAFYYGIKGILDGLHIKSSNILSGRIGTITLLVGVITVWLWPLRNRRVSALAWRVLIVLTLQIILPAKVHVWYFVAPLFVLSMLPVRALSLAWLWVALVAPFTYLFYAWQPHVERVEVLLAEWGGFAVIVLVAAVQGVRKIRRGR